MNFHMPMSDYNLIYTFQNSSGQPKLSMIFLAENNSVQMNWKYYDGDKTSCESTLGEGQVLTIYPEKNWIFETPGTLPTRTIQWVVTQQNPKFGPEEMHKTLRTWHIKLWQET